MKHSLLTLVVLVFLATPATRANTQPSYEEQLKEYDRRVTEQKEQGSRDRWVFNGVMLAVCAGIFLWSRRTSKRHAAALEEMRTAVAESADHNRRIIALLESIERKMPGS